jgi:hypothetical protein
MNIDSSPYPAKTPFVDVFKQSQIGYTTLITTVLERTKVTGSVVNNMIVGLPVAESDALAVLAVLSQYTGKTLTLDNVEVALLSTNARRDRHHG